MEERSEREGFGEANLDEAQAEDPPSDPEMLDRDTETEEPVVPAAPEPGTEGLAGEEAEAAAAEAGAIGGDAGAEQVPPQQRPVEEGGGGEAEGFELAEEDLVETASHGDGDGDPLADRGAPEEEDPEAHTIYGEPDEAETPDRPDRND